MILMDVIRHKWGGDQNPPPLDEEGLISAMLTMYNLPYLVDPVPNNERVRRRWDVLPDYMPFVSRMAEPQEIPLFPMPHIHATFNKFFDQFDPNSNKEWGDILLPAESYL